MPTTQIKSPEVVCDSVDAGAVNTAVAALSAVTASLITADALEAAVSLDVQDELFLNGDAGTAGQVLSSAGAGNPPQWTTLTLDIPKARAVVTANVANLASFNVSTNTDGVTLVAGDVVLLVAQTTAAQNGPYVVGTVAAGVAPLTRPTWFSGGASVKTGFVVQIGGEGNTFKNTTWKAMLAADSFTVNTTDGQFYPLAVSGSAALSSGTATITSVPLRSTTSNVVLTRIGAGTGASSTIMYVLNAAPTAGPIGTATFTIRSALSTGAVNTSDTSTLRWTVINQL